MEFTFEDPPMRAEGRGLIDPLEVEAAEFCRANPGRFIRLKEYERADSAATAASTIRKGTRRAFGSGFDAQSRSLEGKGVVYVKYVGD